MASRGRWTVLAGWFVLTGSVMTGAMANPAVLGSMDTNGTKSSAVSPILVDEADSGRQSIAVMKTRRRQQLYGKKATSGQHQLDSILSNGNATMGHGRQTPTQSEIQLRRALRQKRRKLKRLWQEIGRIQEALKLAASTNQSDGKNQLQIGQHSSSVDAKSKPKKRHWRRRIMQKLKMLSRQLQEKRRKSPPKDTMEKLEALLASLPNEGRERGTKRGKTQVSGVGGRRRGKQSKKRPNQNTQANSTALSVLVKVNGTGARSGERLLNGPVTSATVGPRKLGVPAGQRVSNGTGRNFAVARTVAKKGEAGSTCASHKNCKPGYCCHRINGSEICVQHRFKQGQLCANSCQCDNELQCFISRKDKMHHKRVSSPSWTLQQQDDASSDISRNIHTAYMSGEGQCKIPAMDDVLHGVYIMADNTIFNMEP